MKKKFNIVFLFLIQLCLANVAFAESEWIVVNENAKIKTYAHTWDYGKKLSLEKAIENSMYFAKGYQDWTFNVKLYSKKEFSKTKDFSDEYIYGSALDAMNKQGYGTVSIDYYLWDDEYVSEVGWDSLYLTKLEDNSILCLKLSKPNKIYTADSCVWDKENDVLILKNNSENFEYTVHLYGNEIDQGSYQVLNSDGDSLLEAELKGNQISGNSKTDLTIKLNEDNRIIVHGNAYLYTSNGKESFEFYYKGNFLIK